MGEGARDLAVLAEIQQGVLAKAVQPDSVAGVAIANTHRDEPNMRCSMPGMERCGHDFARNRDRDRAQRILPAILAGKYQFGASPDRRGCGQSEIGSLTRPGTEGASKDNRRGEKSAKRTIHRCPLYRKYRSKRANLA